MIFPFESVTTEIIKKLIKAWLSNKRSTRYMFYILFGDIVAILLTFIGISLKIIPEESLGIPLLAILGLIGLSLILAISSYQSVEDDSEIKESIKTKEQKLRDNPESTSTAWELARLNLESYLDRNLKQVKSIFGWTIFTMFVGFLIIGFGIYMLYQPNADIEASKLATVTGILIQFIGATFLIIYKATMKQASEYVDVLERINAVGMSTQILDSIDKDQIVLKNQTRADLARELLHLYKPEKK